MEDSSFVEKYLTIKDNCDERVLHNIINSLDEKTIDALLDSCDDCLSDMYSYLRWRKSHMTLPVTDFHKNESVQQLLEWYLNQKSKKVCYARKQLCKRFDFVSYDEQCEIIEAFMNRGTISDIVLSCKYLVNDAFWKDEYLPLVEKCLEHLIVENVRSAYPMIKVIVVRSSQRYIESLIHKLDKYNLEESFYSMTPYDLLMPLLITCDKLPDEILNNNTLTAADYVYVMAKKGLKVPETMASMALNEISNDESVSSGKINIVVRSIAKMGYYDLLFDYGVKLNENKIPF